MSIEQIIQSTLVANAGCGGAAAGVLEACDVLVAYNADFDLQVLQNELALALGAAPAEARVRAPYPWGETRQKLSGTRSAGPRGATLN